VKLVRIKVVLFDFDGTMTDGTVYVDQNGVESVRVSRKDGLGIDMLRNAGFELGIISKEKNSVVAARASKLKIPCFQGVDGKAIIIREKYGDRLNEVLFMGDDINDLEAISIVGVGVTLADGHPKCKEVAAFITKARGGEHAVREVCDLILSVQAPPLQVSESLNRF